MRLLLLLVFAWLPISAFAEIQGTNEARARHDEWAKSILKETTWGSPTNAIHLGSKVNRGSNVIWAATYLYAETNCLAMCCPPNGYRLSLSLKAADGKEIKKTEEGKALSKPFNRMAQVRMRLQRFSLYERLPERYESHFTLLNCFDVEKPGIYTLTVGATVFETSVGSPRPIVLPSVSVQVPLAQEDLDAHRAAKEKDTGKVAK